MLFLTTWLHQQGEIGFDAVLLCTILMMSSFGPVVALSSLSNNLMQTLASGERVLSLLEEEPQIEEVSGQATAEFADINCENIDFAYEEEQILKDYSISIPKGSRIGIHGKSGSGKSTLAGLAARLYDASEGEVLIDGKNVKDYSFRGLYDKMGYVTQKAVLFSDTIEGNVAFGEAAQAITEGDVKKAIDISQAQEFIDKMEEGLYSHIAQSGGNVSGGQKQRLSIARAIARNPEILIFDDSFSALDYKTDKELRRRLSTDLKGTTCVIVAQRIGTIRHADKIIVLDDGKMAGIGTHEELMKNCEVYQEIALSQLSKAELA